ncbi:YciI-like protein [Arthrobacter sp. NPDC057013]|uniref:YciI-like protein n=1 Tax=Arthrobacter sp. NPDC057013 TaxID=3345999 RepID=UPI0036429C5C
MHAVLEYNYRDSYLQSREKYRPDHLKAAWEAVERGELLLGGAIGDGPFSGLLIFTGENALEAARAFAAADPYVIGGVVTSWTARLWTTVVGNEAATPVHP